MEPEGAQPRAVCGAVLTGWRERVREAMAMAAHAYLLPAAAQLSRFPAIF